MEHKNRYRYMVSRNAGITPDVEITVHGGEKNRETFEALVMAMRRLRYHQRNNGSAAVEYRICLNDQKKPDQDVEDPGQANEIEISVRIAASQLSQAVLEAIRGKE